MHVILKVIHTRVGFGSGTETTPVFDCLHVQCDRKNCRRGEDLEMMSENGFGLSYSRSRNLSLLLTREAEVINTNLNLFSRYPDSTFAAIDTVEWQDHVFSKSVSKRK